MHQLGLNFTNAPRNAPTDHGSYVAMSISKTNFNKKPMNHIAHLKDSSINKAIVIPDHYID